MKTQYEVHVKYHDHVVPLTVLDVHETGPWTYGAPARVSLTCRPPLRSSGPTCVDMILFCPACGMQHVDAIESDAEYHAKMRYEHERWLNPPHRSHLCANCKHVWRPADVATNGVAEIKTRGKNDSVASRRAPVSLDEAEARMDMASAMHVRDGRGLVRNTDGLPRLYSVTFRPEGGFLVEPVVPSAPDAPIVEREREREAPDTEVEMARRQAERDLGHRTLGTRWTATFDRTERDALLDRLRGELAFPGSGSAAVTIADVAVVREAIAFLKALAP